MLFKQFSDNQMKANISKCHLLVNKKDEVVYNLGETEIKTSQHEKLLGIKVDRKLNFNEHLNDIISSRKVNAFSRVVPYMSLSKKNILMNSFFNSQFSYCPLIGMFHSRIINNKINRMHERCMCLIYAEKRHPLKNYYITARQICFDIHQEFANVGRRDISYNLQSNSNFAVPNVTFVFHGSKSISYLVPKIRDIIPLELKELTSLNDFEISIKNW